VLISALAAATLSPWWLALTILIGANLLFYSAAGWCPATLVMRHLGVADTPACPAPRP